MKNMNNTNDVATIITAAGIYCQGLISHKEIIGGKLLLGCQGCYQDDEIIVISQDGKVVMSHPFSDREDTDISKNFWEIVAELNKAQQMEGREALKELADTMDTIGYTGFIGVDAPEEEVKACILFEKLYPIYGDELLNFMRSCEGHGEDSHMYSHEDDLDIIVDQFIYDSPLWASAVEALEEAIRLA